MHVDLASLLNVSCSTFWVQCLHLHELKMLNSIIFHIFTQFILKLLIAQPPGTPTGVMIPIPQYPLYTAIAAEYGLHPVRDLKKLHAVHPVCTSCVIHTMWLASIPGTCGKKYQYNEILISKQSCNKF